jgi:hypothetical protein
VVAKTGGEFFERLGMLAVLGELVGGFGVLEKGLDRITVGVGIIPRGEVGLIFASIGKNLKVVDDAIFSAVVFMVVVTNVDAAVMFDAVNAMGTMLGAEVVRTANLIQEMTSSVRIEGDERIVSCPVKRGVNQLGDMKQEEVSSMNLHLGLIIINQVALTGVSGEVVTNIYLHLKKDSPLSNTIMFTLANDRVGHIADDAAYDTPFFEVNGTPFARGCAENGIVNGLVEMIRKYF